MTRIRLPFIHEYEDRHGKVRRYVRRSGMKRIPLPGQPGTAEFMESYQAALDGRETQPKNIGASRTKPGTVNAVVVGYYSCVAFRELAGSTQQMRRAILERFREEHGDKRFALMGREHVQAILNRKKPGAARNWTKTLRGLAEFAMAEGFRNDDPTRDVKLPKQKNTGGFHSWTEEEIAQYKLRHPSGTRAARALAVLLCTGQARSDVVRIGRQNVKDGVLTLSRKKTGVRIDIPLVPELLAELAFLPDDQLLFLTTEAGKAFTAAGFGNWFADRCREVGVPGRAHGLRKAAAARLADAGASEHQLMAWFGWTSIREAERYTRAANRKRLAASAGKLIAGTSSG
jgi:integrase